MSYCRCVVLTKHTNIMGLLARILDKNYTLYKGFNTMNLYFQIKHIKPKTWIKYYLIYTLLFLFIITQTSFSQYVHWEKLTTVHYPDYRYSHGMASIGNKKVLLFGGKGRTG